MSRRRIIVGATGASGLPVLVECLELIKETEEVSSVLLMSESAELTLKHETGLSRKDVCALADEVYDMGDIAAGPASGSYPVDGMLIVPCSMKTLAGIHAGYADNLLLRAADVQIKEQRRLVLAVREMPLSPVHLRNMQELSMMHGVMIAPLMMTFYQKPKSIKDMVFHTAARLLSPFGIKAEGGVEWNGL